MNKIVSLLALLLILTTAAEIQAPAARTSATLRTSGSVKVQTTSNGECPMPHHDQHLVSCDFEEDCINGNCLARLCCYGYIYALEDIDGQIVVFATFPGPIYRATQLLNTKSEVRFNDYNFEVHFNCPAGEICLFESDHVIETRDPNMKKE